ncbi:hypothetical protein B0T17DRAFT_509889 [Bombardia bombarda]|uniref:Uncharacterized protein n=1 Tax=Bombardia bombarda TaxID=252184 RepID=A0AA39WN73_9PEZI|nr:hypothetical protein B0T17DRAFT_509889 [Bombardia bombarda]
MSRLPWDHHLEIVKRIRGCRTGKTAYSLTPRGECNWQSQDLATGHAFYVTSYKIAVERPKGLINQGQKTTYVTRKGAMWSAARTKGKKARQVSRRGLRGLRGCEVCDIFFSRTRRMSHFDVPWSIVAAAFLSAERALPGVPSGEGPTSRSRRPSRIQEL